MHYLTNKIYNGDVFEFLDILPDDIFDLAIVDPPYNLKVDEWDIFSSEDEFLNFSFLWIEKIFSTEDKITDAEEIKKIRETKGKEAVDDFFNFCETSESLPKSLTGKAVSYAINQKNNLIVKSVIINC